MKSWLLAACGLTISGSLLGAAWLARRKKAAARG